MNLSRDVHLLYGCQAGKSNESGDMFICGGLLGLSAAILLML